MNAAEFAPAAAVTECLPGPGTAASLDATDIAALPDDELLEVMAGWRRLTSWAQAGELAAVAELIRRRETRHPGAHPAERAEFIADEIALALTLSGGAAKRWAGLACMLADRLPLTRQALAEGRIDLTRARVIADGLLGVEPDTAALVERTVIEEAARTPAARLRRRVHSAFKAVDPQAAEERRQRARKMRSLEKWATAAGTCDLAFREMSEEDAEAVYNRITAAALAMKSDGDTRPVDAIRHDLGVALLRGTPLPEAARDLHRPDCGPGPDSSDLEDTGLEDPAGPRSPEDAEDLKDPRGAEAAEEPEKGKGPRVGRGANDPRPDGIAADTAAHLTGLLADVIDERLRQVTDRHHAGGRRTGLALRVGTAMQAISSSLAEPKERWCEIISGRDPADDGGLHGHPGYRPSAAMRRLIQRIHPVCAFPACDRPASRCDADHTVPWHQGGPTCPCNMASLCRRHHRLKQHPQWHLFQPWPGLLVWVTPAGKWHTVIPEDRQ